jgi:arginine exporter protein ArgO
MFSRLSAAATLLRDWQNVYVVYPGVDQLLLELHKCLLITCMEVACSDACLIVNAECGVERFLRCLKSVYRRVALVSTRCRRRNGHLARMSRRLPRSAGAQRQHSLPF